MNKIKYIIAIIALMFSISHADGDGGTAGAFLNGGIGARPLGMGRAFTAVAEGPEATYYNPAGLGFLVKPTLSMTYQTLSLDRHYGFVAVSFPIKNEAAMGLSWINSGISNVTGRGESQQLIGDIKNHQNAFGVSFSKAIREYFSFGASLHYFQEKYDIIDAFTIGFDAGILVKPHKMLTIGAVVKNAGSNYKWDSSKYWSNGTSYDEKIPITFNIGAAGNLLSETLIPVIELEKNTKQSARFRMGAEYWFVKKIIVRVEDEYEEGKFNNVERNVRWAGLRAGVDRGEPTFGASYIHQINNNLSLAIEYAYVLGREDTPGGHLFTLNIGF